MKNQDDGGAQRVFVTGVMLAGTTAPLANAFPQTKSDRSSPASPAGRLLTIQARPEPIELDTGKTAVVVIDMQNDFGAKGGMFDSGGLDISGIQKAVSPTASVLRGARTEKIKVVYLKMGFHPDLSDLGGLEAPNRTRHMLMNVGKEVRSPEGQPSRILIRDTWNTDILPELKPETNDVVMYKHRFSGFYGTELDAVLKRAGVKDLLITGCTTSVCVESTVRDAMFRDYRCLLVEDCMAEPIGNNLPRTNHEASLLVMQTLFAWVTDSAQVLKQIQSS